jgi:hypothetical protein
MGQQYLWFDWDLFDWKLPYQGGYTMNDEETEQQQPRYNYVLNVYQPFGLAFIAVFASQIPTVRCYPQSLNRSQDVTASKAASNAAALIEENNHMQAKMISLARLLWTDGKIGAFVRYVADKERFGEDEISPLDVGYSKLGEDTFVCPQCKEEMPVSMFAQGQPGVQASMMQNPTCLNCGQPLGEDNFKPALRVPIPLAGQGESIPKGQECVDFFGSLELATPPWANDFWDFPWLQLQFEVHKGKLKAAYPNAAAKIEDSSTLNAEDVYARASRLAVAQGLPVLHPGDVMYNLLTYTRTWLRPWAFDTLKESDKVKQLKQLFPDGCYVAFAGDVYCESRNEAMSDHWRVMHALPGDGQSRPGIGEASIEAQDQINTLANIAVEQFEYGIPPILYDPEVLDSEAITQRTVEPAEWVPARGGSSRTTGNGLQGGIFQPTPAQVPEALYQYLQELTGPMFQLLTGVTAAVFGGSMDDVKTAKAYQQARDMSLGRLSTPWTRFKDMYAEVMQLAVKCFRDNRTGDVERILPGENSEFEAQEIKIADLDGGFVFRSEPDETYPRLRSQKLGVLQQLMALNDPDINAMLKDPSNIGMVKMILGLNEFNLPTDDARMHQLREIEEMLANPGMPDPLTGQIMPTVKVSQFDNHQVHIAEIARWTESDDGQEAEKSNPQGYATVEQHGLVHKQFLAQAQMPAPNPLAAIAAAAGAKKPQQQEPPEQPNTEPLQASAV